MSGGRARVAIRGMSVGTPTKLSVRVRGVGIGRSTGEEIFLLVKVAGGEMTGGLLARGGQMRVRSKVALAVGIALAVEVALAVRVLAVHVVVLHVVVPVVLVLITVLVPVMAPELAIFRHRATVCV